jgi:two-component system chemotaxis sensor kinase CheA
MIGELVIVESMIAHAPEVQAIVTPKIRNFLSQFTKISRDLQDVGMSMRMVPVRGVFQKMARMVRDLARKNDKQINLVQSGEGTEMDRSMVERIHDPLVHMIRNSVDHGIETAEERARTGKPAAGTIRLAAYHQGGSIVIEIADDGRGLDRAAILAKAVSKGLVKEGETLSDAAIYDLVFAPGFSTAKVVTELSGRGVGMDVVKRNIEAMRGRIITESKAGRGTVFKLVLPLTLAIIDGMIVRCGEEKYIVPTLSILESIQPKPEMITTIAGRAEVLNVRGQIIPLVRLDRLFGVEGAIQEPTEALVILVESMGATMGLLADEVLVQQQVVIKNLTDGANDSKLVSGAAILSDGRVGLILNVDEIVRHSTRGGGDRAGEAWVGSGDGLSMPTDSGGTDGYEAHA